MNKILLNLISNYRILKIFLKMERAKKRKKKKRKRKEKKKRVEKRKKKEKKRRRKKCLRCLIFLKCNKSFFFSLSFSYYSLSSFLLPFFSFSLSPLFHFVSLSLSLSHNKIRFDDIIGKEEREKLFSFLRETPKKERETAVLYLKVLFFFLSPLFVFFFCPLSFLFLRSSDSYFLSLFSLLLSFSPFLSPLAATRRQKQKRANPQRDSLSRFSLFSLFFSPFSPFSLFSK